MEIAKYASIGRFINTSVSVISLLSVGKLAVSFVIFRACPWPAFLMATYLYAGPKQALLGTVGFVTVGFGEEFATSGTKSERIAFGHD